MSLVEVTAADVNAALHCGKDGLSALAVTFEPQGEFDYVFGLNNAASGAVVGKRD